MSGLHLRIETEFNNIIHYLFHIQNSCYLKALLSLGTHLQIQDSVNVFTQHLIVMLLGFFFFFHLQKFPFIVFPLLLKSQSQLSYIISHTLDVSDHLFMVLLNLYFCP